MKAYKIELLVIDFENVGNDIQSMIEDQRYPNDCISPSVMDIKEMEIGEWTDNHPLNSRAEKKNYYNLIFNLNKEKEELLTKLNNLEKVHQRAMQQWEDEWFTGPKMELAVLNSKLEPCTLDGGDMDSNIISLKFDNPDRVKGLRMSSKASVILERN